MRSRAAFFLFASAGCLDPTQATLQVSTNVDCGAEGPTDGAFFEAGVLAAASPSGLPDAPNGTTRGCTPGAAGVHDVGSMVVFPEDGAVAATAVVIGSLGSVTAEQCVPFAKGDATSPVRDQCIVARRAITFADHRPLTIPVLLDSQCAGVACPDSQTCARTAAGAACVDSTVVCEGATCNVPNGDGGGGGGDGAGGSGGSGGAGSEVTVFYDGTIGVRAVTGLRDGVQTRLFVAGREAGAAVDTIYEIGLQNMVVGTVLDVMSGPVTGVEARDTALGPRLAAASAMRAYNINLQTLDPNDTVSQPATPTDAVPDPGGVAVLLVDGTNTIDSWDGTNFVADDVGPGLVALDAASNGRVAAGPGICFFPGTGCEPQPAGDSVVDVWTGTGDEAFTVSSAGLVKLVRRDGFGEAAARLPLDGGAVALIRAKGHQIVADTVFGVWVGGSRDGAGYLAHGVRNIDDPSALAFVEIDLSGFGPIVDMWAENRAKGRLFAALSDGRVIAVTAP